MTVATKKLETQLKKAEKTAETLRKKLEAEKLKNKPKSIMDRVKNFSDVLKIAKPTKEELALVKYVGKSKSLNFAKNMLVLSLISQVLNEGWTPKMDGSEYRYYPYYRVSSGFDFGGTYFGCDAANTSSAFRLCFKTSELAEFAGKTFENEYKSAIMS